MEGSLFETWILESAVLEDPLLKLVSPKVLTNPHEILDKLGEGPYRDLVGFCYRQFQQFQREEKHFRLKYQDYQQMNEIAKTWREEFSELIPAEEKQRLLEEDK